MHCLITGATGFIGSHLASTLANGDNNRVTCLVRENSDTKRLEENDKVRILRQNNQEQLDNVFADTNADVVYHIASNFIARHNSKDIRPLVESNILFPAILLEAMSKFGVKNFVNIGTAWQNPYSADYAPTCLYAATKQAFCDLLEFYTRHKGINATTLKLFDTYGPDDTRPKIMNLLRRAAQTGETLNMSPGEQRLDFVHVDDVVRAITMAGEHLYNSISLEKEYAVCTRKPISLRELVALIEDKTGKKLNINWGALPYRDGEIMLP